MSGVSLLLKLKLNEFHFCKQYCRVLIMDKPFQEKYKVWFLDSGWVFLKSLSIFMQEDPWIHHSSGKLSKALFLN